MNYQCKLRGKRCPFLGSSMPQFEIKIYCNRNRKQTSMTLSFPLGVIGVLLFVEPLLQVNSDVLAAPNKAAQTCCGRPLELHFDEHWQLCEMVLAFRALALPTWESSAGDWGLCWAAVWDQSRLGAGGNPWALIICYLSPMDLAVCDPRARLRLLKTSLNCENYTKLTKAKLQKEVTVLIEEQGATQASKIQSTSVKRKL